MSATGHWLAKPRIFRREAGTPRAVSALKFTEQGAVRVTGSQDARGADWSELTIVVSDSGAGRTEEQVLFVFEPCAQGDEATTRRYGGTGLGLHICRALVELMQGTLTVESRPGKGTTFRIRLRSPLPPP